MKKLLFILIAVSANIALMAQNTAKKYVLIEHFTNSRCPICASKNPAFYNTIAPYSADVHHISIHPSVPYNTCVFYVANKTENQARADFYGIPGTPRVALNGTFLPSSSALLPVSTLQSFLNQTSPVSLKVSDAMTGSTFSTTVDIRYLNSLPPGNYRLFVALVEKTINQATPNGETVHRDVFRDMLTDVAGDVITPGSVGTSTKLTFSSNISAAWNTSELYALAFIQNMGTREVMNSGTRFDPVVTATQEPTTTRALRVYPNPAGAEVSIPLEQDRISVVEAYSLNGQRATLSFQQAERQVQVNTEALQPGAYVLKLVGQNAVYTARMVRQ